MLYTIRDNYIKSIYCRKITFCNLTAHLTINYMPILFENSLKGIFVIWISLKSKNYLWFYHQNEPLNVQKLKYNFCIEMFYYKNIIYSIKRIYNISWVIYESILIE